MKYSEAVDKVRETCVIGMIIGEILCLFAYIDYTLFLIPLELWIRLRINFSVTIIRVSLHRITINPDYGYWKIKFSEASWKKLNFGG